MSHIWVAYRDVQDARKGFEVIELPPPPDARFIKNQKFPGALGLPDMYIQWHTHQDGNNTLHLVTYTEHEVGPEEAARLCREALEFAGSHRP